MLNKIINTLKEVFWIKPSRRKSRPVRRKNARKPVVKKKVSRKVPQRSVAKPKPKVLKVKAVKAPKSKIIIDPSLTEVGAITHYFDRIKVCVVKVTYGTILIGDKLTVFGPKTKFVQKVWSMQVESEDVKVAKKGQLIGIKVDKLVHVGDKVYK